MWLLMIVMLAGDGKEIAIMTQFDSEIECKAILRQFTKRDSFQTGLCTDSPNILLQRQPSEKDVEA